MPVDVSFRIQIIKNVVIGVEPRKRLTQVLRSQLFRFFAKGNQIDGFLLIRLRHDSLERHLAVSPLLRMTFWT